MDFFGGWRPSPGVDSNLSVRDNEMLIAEDIANQQLIKEKQMALAKARNINLNKNFRAGVNTAGARMAGVIGQSAEAVGVAERQGTADFSSEQRMLGQMFGQGEKIWGTNMQPVRINNDLNSSRSNPFDETSSMFGFGHQGERSGLF